MPQIASWNTGQAEPDNSNLEQAGLIAFFNIAELWGLNNEQEITLLGNPPRSTFFKWKKNKVGKLSHDTLERISYVLGIYKSLQVLLPNEQAADGWVKKPNSAPLFNSQTALDKMLAGRVVDLADVRRYLDAERGW